MRSKLSANCTDLTQSAILDGGKNMKFEKNQKYFTIARYATMTIVISATIILAIFNIEVIVSKLSSFTSVATPIIIGIFSAYILNPLMKYLENGLFGKWARSEYRAVRTRARIFALTLTMIIVLAIITLLILLVLPQLVNNIVSFFDNFEHYAEQVHKFIDNLSAKIPFLGSMVGDTFDNFDNFISKLWEDNSKQILGFAANVASGVVVALDAMKNLFLGLTIAIYLLAKKEMFTGQSKKLLFAFVKPERAHRFLGVCNEASKKFLGSIIGKIVEAFVVAMLLFIACQIVGIPFAPLIAAIMFVFNLIPYIGPIIGAVPCSLLLLLSEKPSMTIWFIVIVCITQLLDGNIIAPWILGDSTGLPAVWILISIVIGGGFFGMLGMLLSVPICAVLYMLFKDFVEHKLKKRGLPQSTSNYVGSVDYITADYVYDESTMPEFPAENSEKPKKIHFRDRVRQKSVQFSEKFMNVNKGRKERKDLHKVRTDIKKSTSDENNNSDTKP